MPLSLVRDRVAPRPRALIVEDDKTSAVTMRKMLSSEGYDVVGTAADSLEALRLFDEKRPDIVLMDISIEGEVDGVDTAGRLRRTGDVPVVFLSGFSDRETIERASRTNPVGYMLKPFTKKELLITLHMALYKHKLERAQRRHEERLRTILQHLPAAVFYANPAGRVVFLNQEGQQLLGSDGGASLDEDLLEQLRLHRFPGDEAVTTLGALVSASSGAATPPLYRLRGHPQTPLVRVRALQVHADEDEATGEDEGEATVVLVEDVTAEHTAERKIRMLAAALESLDDAVLITAPELEAPGPRVLYLNAACARLTGLTRSEAEGRDWDELGLVEDPAALRGRLRDPVERGGTLHEDVAITTARGDTRLTQWRASMVKDRRGQRHALVFILRDVTTVRKMEENIRQSQKIEAVGRLAGGIAHDFNNLLSVINSYADLLVERADASGGDPSETTLKYARQIRAAGQRGADLVAKLMAFSRRDQPRPGALVLNTVCEELKAMLRRLIREDILLETHFADKLPAVRADQGQVEQALINLCVNARDAMPHGGTIRIRTEARDVDTATSGAPDNAPAGTYVVLSVIDDGCGIDAETQRYIFDPFFTTKEIGKGTGLGLSTVYGMMRQMGGFVTVQSEVGVGSCFDLYFPVAADNALRTPSITESREQAGGNETVFVVEDDETFLDCIAGMLHLHGYKVVSAADGGEALDKLESVGADIDLLIADVVLPQFSGRDVAARLREVNPQAAIILMTGYDDQLDPAEADGDHTLVLQKPFPLNTLMLQVRQLLDERAASD